MPQPDRASVQAFLARAKHEDVTISLGPEGPYRRIQGRVLAIEVPWILFKATENKEGVLIPINKVNNIAFVNEGETKA